MSDRPPPIELRFQLVVDRAALLALASAWQALLRRGRPEAMQSPDWLLPWWDIYSANSDRQLRVGAFWAADRLVGLAPLCRRAFRHRGGLTFRRLEFLGADVDENDGVCSEYLGLIADPAVKTRVLQDFVRQLARGAFGAWDEVVLAAMDGSDDQTRRLIDAFHAFDLDVHVEETTQAPFASLPDSWDAFLGQLSKSRRWNLRTQLKDFDAWAQGQAIWHEVQTPEELERGKRILHELHEVRWKAEGKSGVFAAERFRRFHDIYMRRLLDQGKLELLWLEKAGRPLAALYAFREAGKVCFYQSGRVMDLPQKIRVGAVIVAHAIRRAIERGEREFDFLGGPARYKLAFTRTTRPIVRLRSARPSVVETLRAASEGIWNEARRLRAWWRRETPGTESTEL